ncbi:MAG TPA: hypothetical protein VGA53_02265 [Candidatus Paceibacterota bacterium]
MSYELRIYTNIRIVLLAVVAIAGLLGAYAVFAQEEPDIEFPVAELGNCQSKEECKAYCDEIEHIAQCVDFAERHGLMHGVELEEAKKVAHALSQGAQLPGGCRGKEECEVYCSEPTHIEECLAFAEAAGFMSAEELEDARRVAPLMARGEMPGGCRSREECEAYCSQDSHTEECVTFFQKAGFMTAEEAEMFRKTGGRGPGDCKGREECDAFCNNPENQKECFAFAKEHDLIPEEELHNIEEGLTRFHEGFQHAPPEVAQCLKDTIGEDVLAKIEAGTFLPNRELGEHMQKCFENFMPASPAGGPRPTEGFRPEGGEHMAPPEVMGCVERILGDTRQLQGSPTSEQEQRIREECFPQQSQHPQGFEGEMPQEFREEFERQHDEQFQEEYQRQFEQQIQEFQEFHAEETPAESRLPRESFLGAVAEAMRPGLKILFPFLPL